MNRCSTPEWRSPYAARRTIGADRMVNILVQNGWPFEWRANQPQAVAEALDSLRALMDLGLPHAGPPEAPLFDPAELRHFVRWAGLYRQDPTYDRVVEAGRRLAWEPYPPATRHAGPPNLAALPPQPHRLTVWRTMMLDAAPGCTIRLRLPAPTDGRGGTVLDPAGIVRRSTPGPARMDLALTMPDGPIRLGIRMDAIDSAGLDDEPGELDLYLRPSEGWVHRGPRIDALAGHLAGTATGLLAIRRFWDFIFGALSINTIHSDLLEPAAPLHTVLDTGWSDCRSACALLVALCRARGIPARIVNGYTLHRTAPGFHTWAEAWVGGAWHPFDLLDLSSAGRDPAWAPLYFGQLRQRLAIERLPHAFTGAGALRMPAAWHMLSRLVPDGTEVAFHALDTGMGPGRLIYADTLSLGHQP